MVYNRENECSSFIFVYGLAKPPTTHLNGKCHASNLFMYLSTLCKILQNILLELTISRLKRKYYTANSSTWLVNCE